MAPGRLQEGLVKVVHFWSQFQAKNEQTIYPKELQKLLKNMFKDGA
jgi:hypothetical protein